MGPVGQVRKYVREDEELLWLGVPDASVWVSAEDARLIPFSIIFCGFGLFWVYSAVTSGAPVMFCLLGSSFVAFGFYAVVGHFWYKWYHKRHTAYAITTRRAMIVRPRSFADLPLRDQPVEVRRSRDSRHASVTFPDKRVLERKPASAWGKPRGYAPGPNTGMAPPFGFAFYDVASPDAMLRALDQARARRAE